MPQQKPQARSNQPRVKARARLYQDGNTSRLRLYGVVGDWLDGFTDEDVADLLEQASGDMTVHLNTPGGMVDQGMAIHNMLASYQGEIRVVVDGLAASMGSVIAMAGATVAMYPGSMMMIHNPWNIVLGDSNDMRKNADTLDKFRDAMLAIYERKTGQDRETLTAMMDEETWLTAEEAVEWGFADEVIDTGADGIDPEAAIAQLDLSILGNTEIPNRVAQAVARHRIAGQSSDASRAAEPADVKGNQEETDMPNAVDTKTSADTKAAEKTEEQIRAEAVESERKRAADIRRNCRIAKLGEEFANTLIEQGVSAETAKDKIFEKLQEQEADTEISGQVRAVPGQDASEKFRAQAVDAVLMRANVKQVDGANEMRGFGLLDYARACLEHAGVKTVGMSKQEIAKAALTHSTSDFPNIFENAMHKTLLAAYEGVDLTWSQFCSTGDLTDFRPHLRYRMGSFPRLSGLNENGELKHTTLPDAERESITADENGLIFTLSYKMLVNDDLGAFISVAQALGRTAALSVEEDVYTTLTANAGAGPVLSDGNNMFDNANHGNLASSGAAPSVSTLGAARTAMRKQKDPGGNSYIMLNPSILLTPVAIEDEAWQVINSPTDPSKTNSRVVNRENNRWNLLSSPYLDEVSAAAWYAFADPAQAPAIEVGFVGGQTTPMVEMEEMFTSRGIAYRVTHDYGVAGRDYRPAYKNPGQ